MSHITEVHAYIHILKELTEKKGWKKEQIYTQNETQNNLLLKHQLDKETPENIVSIDPTNFYVIEAKSTRIMVNQALKEAKYYAEKINQSQHIKALFVTGIAGNEQEGYVSKSQYLQNGTWKDITQNDAEITGLISKTEVDDILRTNNPVFKDVEISDKDFLKTAEEINGVLHENGIIKDDRAKVISAILLALSLKTEIPLTGELPVIVNQINTMVDLVLRRENKIDFARFIHIPEPSSSDNHTKWKTAIVKTIEALYGINIHSAMRSGKDVLGKFYEAFLKYGNGAKDLGIVLTPRHITRFAAEVMDIQANDLVLDPTCGTGGFLVAAFEEVKHKASEADFNKFKKYGLYGIEDKDPIVALALVNMIFRGDGKNNISEGDCFANWYTSASKYDDELHQNISFAKTLKRKGEGRVPPITKVLMNPPFPKKKSDKKEYLFVEHALKQMQNEGLLFSVLPYSCMIKGGGYLAWRTRLLRENTLLAVVTFPPELFSPVGVRTCGIFVKKGVEQGTKKVLWLRIMHDGFRLKKGRRIEVKEEQDDLKNVKENVRNFLKDQTILLPNIPEFQKIASINYPPNQEDDVDNPLYDKELELCPEAYLDEKPVSTQEMNELIDKLMREALAFNIKFEREIQYANRQIG
ncbi:MAG: N-6 DNA methylase [Bacteroidales bacterium]|nr:N-6 DNA methylase [Bacteroidales bacterium]